MKNSIIIAIVFSLFSLSHKDNTEQILNNSIANGYGVLKKTANASLMIYEDAFKTSDYVNIFQSIITDSAKCVIIHTPITGCLFIDWPVTINTTVTDPSGVDSVWVVWKKHSYGQRSRFNLSNISGDNWTGIFNSDSSQVYYGDSIYYKIFARDVSVRHNIDSTEEYGFKISTKRIIAVGSDTISVGWPFYTFYMDSRTDILLLRSEMNISASPRTVYSIGFHINSFSPQLMNGFKVKLKNTTENSITYFTYNNWTTVYDSSYNISDTGWQYIDFQFPFIYQANKNLLIEVCFNNSLYTTNTFVYASNATNKNLHQHSDLTSGDGCQNIYTPWNSYTQRPNVRIYSTEGIVIKTENKEEYIPQKYTLTQNYPNPFNPSTKINFAIPKQGLVTLKLYDVLGREVASLVNEVKTAGSYIVDFDASALSGGVYFYKLEVNGYSDVKRMILIK